MKVTILVADDHDDVRQGVRSFLETQDDLCVIGEVSDGREVVERVKELQPHVLLIDWKMGGKNGMQVAQQVLEMASDTRIVMLSLNAEESYAMEARRHGVLGYVVKQASATYLIEAIREASAGRVYLSPPLSEEALKDFGKRGKFPQALKPTVHD